MNEELIPIEPTEPISAEGKLRQLQALERIADEYMATKRKIILHAISHTNENHWYDYGGKPYLTAAGCNLVMDLCGMSSEYIGSMEEHPGEDEDGRYIDFVQYAQVFFQGKKFVAMGAASTKDPFFNRSKERLPLSGISTANVRKKTATNALGNAIRKAAGIDLTWPQLRAVWESKGKKVGAAKSVEFEEGKRGGSGKKLSNKALHDLRHAIGTLCLTIQEGDKEKAKQLLKDESAFKGKEGEDVPGVDSCDKLSIGRAKVTFSKLWGRAKTFGLAEKAAEEFKEGFDPEEYG